MPQLNNVISDPETVLNLEPEELAGLLLEQLNIDPDRIYDPRNLSSLVEGYPSGYQPSLLKALMEAWVWLEREGLVAPHPQQANYYFVTRRGKKLKNPSDLAAFSRGNMLPKALLHPVIAQKVWSTFLRGEYDTAVFQAFKAVEVAVREAGRFDAGVLGVDLMRQAFREKTGPLTDTSSLVSEQQAIANLFAGAIGYYKNPGSHRQVTIAEPAEAVEMIMLASHLLRIVDARSTVP